MRFHTTPGLTADDDPFDESLWGEYARLLLIGTAACSVTLWAVRLTTQPAAIVMVVANACVMGFAIGNRFAGLRRLTVLLLLAIGIGATFFVIGDPAAWWNPLLVFSPAMTMAALLVLGFRDGMIAFRRTNAISPWKLAAAAGVFAIALYMIVIPGVDAILELFRERPQSYVVEELSPLEILRVRSAKLAVFAIFAYAGACVGSFLNVVAASAPRGEAIALRSSACPKCGSPIRRRDNLPIVSYLNLRGRCRNCDAEIPVRYLVVEWMGLAIFASLFLYELVTGAANIPGFQHYQYAGILWIILYTKWPVVGAYFFHCLLFSSVLTLALMEQDRLPAPRWMKLALPTLFAAIVIGIPTMLTVSLGDQTPLRFPAAFPDWLDRAATCAAGGAAGWTVASLTKSIRLRRSQSSSSLKLAFVLIGIALGWQAVLTIATFWIFVGMILKSTGNRVLRPRWLTPTTLLFAIAMLHHPAWKWLANRLSF